MRYIEKFKVPVRFTVFRALTPPGSKRFCAAIILKKCASVRTFPGEAFSRNYRCACRARSMVETPIRNQ